NFNITSRTLPRNASLNRSGPKRPSIWLKHCILFPIGVFLLGLTLPMSQILFWDTERIRLLYFPQQAGRRLAQAADFRGLVATLSHYHFTNGRFSGLSGPIGIACQLASASLQSIRVEDGWTIR